MKPLLSILVIAVLVAFSSIDAESQILFNNGANIYVAPNTLVVVNGDTRQSGGEIRVQDSATVYFNGMVDVRGGGIYLLRGAYARILRNLIIAQGAIVWRYSPGTLDIEGSYVNDGELINEGEILLGKP